MDSAQEIKDDLKQKIAFANLPAEIEEKLLDYLKLPITTADIAYLVVYINFVTSLPFAKYSQDILDLERAKQILNKNHYGLQNVKDRILEYLSVLILNNKKNYGEGLMHTPILSLIGLVGTGKTSLAFSIAECLGRPIIRIPFGGLGDASMLKGQSRQKPESEPGQILKGIKYAKVSNPIILLDEIDRVAEATRVEVMGVLVELLDPQQNHQFVDRFLDFPYDLSRVLFITTVNNTTNIATAVMDRLEPIEMPSYSDEEKMTIGKGYLLPKTLKESGLDSNILIIDQLIWPQIIRPLGYDGGIRSLERSIQMICRKIARKVVEGGFGPFMINSNNLSEYISN